MISAKQEYKLKESEERRAGRPERVLAEMESNVADLARKIKNYDKNRVKSLFDETTRSGPKKIYPFAGKGRVSAFANRIANAINSIGYDYEADSDTELLLYLCEIRLKNLKAEFDRANRKLVKMRLKERPGRR